MRIAVVGIGNVLMQDDAVGPYVVQTLLAGYRFPDNVSVVDLGTPGPDLACHLEGVEALILVDTVKSSGSPGEIRLYRKDDLLRHPAPTRTSPHEPGLKETLLRLDLVGKAPREVLLVGVIPEIIRQGTCLGAAVKEAVPRAVDEVLAELSRLDSPAVPLAAAKSPDLWWERT